MSSAKRFSSEISQDVLHHAPQISSLFVKSILPRARWHISLRFPHSLFPVIRFLSESAARLQSERHGVHLEAERCLLSAEMWHLSAWHLIRSLTGDSLTLISIHGVWAKRSRKMKRASEYHLKEDTNGWDWKKKNLCSHFHPFQFVSSSYKFISLPQNVK